MEAPQRGKRKSPEQYRKLARSLAQGTPVGRALLEAGYSHRQSLQGYEAVPAAVLSQLPSKAKKLVALGKTDKETRKHLVRGRLIANTVRGKDGGAMSAKILGSDKELGMWQPDSQQGLVVIGNLSPDLENRAKLLLEDDNA
jgi:hypothetical protein